MPVYDYDCAACGPFEATRPMAEFQAPQPCRECGAAAPRVLLTAPRLAGMDPAQRRASATNERSAHAPQRASRAHPASCGCCKPGGRKLAADSGAARPWMLG